MGRRLGLAEGAVLGDGVPVGLKVVTCMGLEVGQILTCVGSAVGASVGLEIGTLKVGAVCVGAVVLTMEGEGVGAVVLTGVGERVGAVVLTKEGLAVGIIVGC